MIDLKDFKKIRTVGRKKYVTYEPSGHEAMIIDCDEYEVTLNKTIDKEKFSDKILFYHKSSNNVYPLNIAIIVDWDKPEDGGKLTIHYRDRNGSEMIFTHYDPSDIKGMFDFIAKGYDIYDRIHNPINEDVLKQAISRFGVGNQLEMVNEEAGELLQAINKIKRRKGIVDNKITAPTNESSIQYCLSYWGLCSEVADIKIMAKQLELMLCKEAIDLSSERKVSRLNKKILKEIFEENSKK